MKIVRNSKPKVYIAIEDIPDYPRGTVFMQHRYVPDMYYTVTPKSKEVHLVDGLFIEVYRPQLRLEKTVQKLLFY